MEADDEVEEWDDEVATEEVEEVDSKTDDKKKLKPTTTIQTSSHFCTQDEQKCDYGSFVGRDSANERAFFLCPDDHYDGDDAMESCCGAK
jgi:hypothetical protein